jgi:hypothetical protein
MDILSLQLFDTESAHFIQILLKDISSPKTLTFKRQPHFCPIGFERQVLLWMNGFKRHGDFGTLGFLLQLGLISLTPHYFTEYNMGLLYPQNVKLLTNLYFVV